MGASSPSSRAIARLLFYCRTLGVHGRAATTGAEARGDLEPFIEGQNRAVRSSDQSRNMARPIQRDERMTRNANRMTRAARVLAFRVIGANRFLATTWRDQ
jgi:hypothetical protein